MFKVPEIEEEVNSVTSYVWLKGSYTECLPSLKGIDLVSASNIGDLDDADRVIVAEYMEKGKISDFAHLKKFHRLSVFIWSMSLIGPDGSEWGVVTFDSSRSDPNSRNFKNIMKKYTGLIEIVANS